MYYNKLKKQVFIERNELHGEFSEEFVLELLSLVDDGDFPEFIVPCNGLKKVIVNNMVSDKTYVTLPSQKEDLDKIEKLRNYAFYLELTKEFDDEIEFMMDDE